MWQPGVWQVYERRARSNTHAGARLRASLLRGSLLSASLLRGSPLQAQRNGASALAVPRTAPGSAQAQPGMGATLADVRAASQAADRSAQAATCTISAEQARGETRAASLVAKPPNAARLNQASAGARRVVENSPEASSRANGAQASGTGVNGSASWTMNSAFTASALRGAVMTARPWDNVEVTISAWPLGGYTHVRGHF